MMGTAGVVFSGKRRPAVGRWLADIDPETGDLIVDEEGLPVLVMHYTAEEVAAWLGTSPAEVRRRCRGGEWECRVVPPRGTIYLSQRHVAAAIESQTTRTRREWDASWQANFPGIRGVVIDPDDEADEDEAAR